MRPNTSVILESTKKPTTVPSFPSVASAGKPPVLVSTELSNKRTVRSGLDLKSARRNAMRLKTQPSDHSGVPRTSFSTVDTIGTAKGNGNPVGVNATASTTTPAGIIATTIGRTSRFSTPNAVVSNHTKSSSSSSAAATATSTAAASALHPGGRDSLIADLFWTFHGENANKFSDVTLISSDDCHFPVCRGILAARSAYFAKLLYPDKSRHVPMVGVALPSSVLEVVLHYLHTGDIPASSIADRPALDRLLAVARAAHDMHHEAMLADIVRNILVMVDMNLSMLCAVLEAFCGQVPFGDDEQVLNTLLSHVRANPSATLVLPDFSPDDPRLPVQGSPAIKKTGVLELSRRALETLVIKDKREAGADRVADEYWFYVIWYWAIHGCSKSESNCKSNQNSNTLLIPANGSDAGHDTATITASPESSDLKGESDLRRAHATAIIDLLDPSRMRAEFLLRIVEPTALMSLHKLCEGYKSHATRNLRSVDTGRKRVRFFSRYEKR